MGNVCKLICDPWASSQNVRTHRRPAGNPMDPPMNDPWANTPDPWVSHVWSTGFYCSCTVQPYADTMFPPWLCNADLWVVQYLSVGCPWVAHGSPMGLECSAMCRPWAMDLPRITYGSGPRVAHGLSRVTLANGSPMGRR